MQEPAGAPSSAPHNCYCLEVIPEFALTVASLAGISHTSEPSTEAPTLPSSEPQLCGSCCQSLGVSCARCTPRTVHLAACSITSPPCAKLLPDLLRALRRSSMPSQL